MEIVTTNNTTERRASATCEIPDKDYLHLEPESLTTIRTDSNSLEGTHQSQHLRISPRSFVGM